MARIADTGALKACALTVVFCGAFTAGLAPVRGEDAKPSASADRCEGTLCDLYYGSRPAQPDPAARPASQGGLLGVIGRSNGPANAPQAAEPSSTNNYMSVGGGGLLGGRQERCTGSLCDMYYGARSPSGGSEPQRDARAGSTPPEPPVVHRHIVHESETRPKCSSPTADPWHCFR